MRTALITGASRGLGLALTRALATALPAVESAVRWRPVVDARDASTLVGATRDLGDEVVAIAGDVADAAHRRALVAAAGPRLDLLVLNASTLGISPLPPLAAYDIATLRDVFEVNAIAPLALTQLALPALRAAHGRVIAVSSDTAVAAYEGWGGYGASKAALDQLAHVLGAEESALRVYAVDPGDMRTAMHAAAFPGEDISDRPGPETVAPALISLIDGSAPSGRYVASELLVGSSR
ncbi:MAG: SDR family NAD(P)-dependent oxidoreductase [Mycobacteriales bacterium]